MGGSSSRTGANPTRLDSTHVKLALVAAENSAGDALPLPKGEVGRVIAPLVQLLHLIRPTHITTTTTPTTATAGSSTNRNRSAKAGNGKVRVKTWAGEGADGSVVVSVENPHSQRGDCSGHAPEAACGTRLAHQDKSTPEPCMPKRTP